jgi:hypothetical protein
MSSRDTYIASVKSAVATKLANDLADEVSRQTTIDAQLSGVGYTLQSGSYSSLKALSIPRRRLPWPTAFSVSR